MKLEPWSLPLLSFPCPFPAVVLLPPTSAVFSSFLHPAFLRAQLLCAESPIFSHLSSCLWPQFSSGRKSLGRNA